MSGWKFEYQLRDNSLGYTGRTTWERSDPKPPATWAANDPAPPDGTIVADDHLAPWILEDGIWRCAMPHRVVTVHLHGLTRSCKVLRWGWNK